MVSEQRLMAGLALFPDTHLWCQSGHTSFTSTEKATKPSPVITAMLAQAAWAHSLDSLPGGIQVKMEAQL